MVAATTAADNGCAACGCAACADDGCAQEEAERGRDLRLDGGAACRSSRGRRRWRRRRRRRRRSNRCSRCRDCKHRMWIQVRRPGSNRYLCDSNIRCNRCTYWYRRPEGGMCRMLPGSWPTPRDNHSTRSGLICKSCTAPIQQQSHQSRTSRCSPLPSRGVGAAAAVDCASGDCGCAMTTEGRSPRSRCRGCTPTTGLRVRRRRSRHPRPSCTCFRKDRQGPAQTCAAGGGPARLHGIVWRTWLSWFCGEVEVSGYPVGSLLPVFPTGGVGPVSQSVSYFTVPPRAHPSS